ncbi:DUF6087 family protein [Streptomyces mobaraensis]|nr:DUF6087 family protein [Streptomyces mobaraensis]
MHEESLEEWARRREARRARSKGKLGTVPLTSGPHRGGHVEPAAPRVIQEWSGREWVTVGIVPDLALARAILYPPQPPEERAAEWDRPAMGRGRDRHRKPSGAEQQRDQ